MAKENDIVLIYLEDEPIAFARIEHISPDVKKDWYNVKLLMLQVPLQATTWILRDIYINGQVFTMGGKRVRLEQVVCPKDPDSPEKKQEIPEKQSSRKVISLADLKKKA
ncbi:MAG: hypothetical protein JRJ46_13535 [Deltaproteobacteria bacterium]|nr:hypothetical protein [Deltaproteobacteria bacterium]